MNIPYSSAVVLVPVLPASLLIQLLASVAGRAELAAQYLGPLYTCGHLGDPDGVSCFCLGLDQKQLVSFKSESIESLILSLSFLSSLCFAVAFPCKSVNI